MDIYDLLNELSIKYEEEVHKKVFTVDEAKNENISLDGIGCKNLFLIDELNRYYLVVMVDTKRCDFLKLCKELNVKKLSFASVDALNAILGLDKGSVTPLGIINDTDNLVHIILDKDIVDKNILVHPNRNDRTICINYFDLLKIIGYCNHTFTVLDM